MYLDCKHEKVKQSKQKMFTTFVTNPSRFTDAASREVVAVACSHFAAVASLAFLSECVAVVVTGAAFAAITLKPDMMILLRKYFA